MCLEGGTTHDTQSDVVNQHLGIENADVRDQTSTNGGKNLYNNYLPSWEY